MRFRVQMTCDNEAFTPEPGQEIARILRVLVRKLELGETRASLVDINGNQVGVAKLEGD